MLGMLLYEVADLAYNVSRITYNGARGIYYWYYDMDYPEQEEIKKREEVIIELTKRIKHLEELQGLTNNIETETEVEHQPTQE
jgi:hypothetical protein